MVSCSIRYAVSSPVVVGSLLLGLYDDEGVLHRDGFPLVFGLKSSRVVDPTQPGATVLGPNPFYQIYVMDLASGEAKRVSNGMGKTTCAFFRPGTDEIEFASTHGDPKSKHFKDQAERYSTGNLRDVMKESISAAASYVRSRAITYGIEPPLFERRDIHVHVPEGATPKDGPSAGVAMATTIVSVLTGIPIRHDVAMTGEITLRGRVLPIGGLKEKLLAAGRGGIKTVFIPEDNAKDLTEISDAIKGGMEIIPVARMDEVLAKALVRMPVPPNSPRLEPRCPPLRSSMPTR